MLILPFPCMIETLIIIGSADNKNKIFRQS